MTVSPTDQGRLQRAQKSDTTEDTQDPIDRLASLDAKATVPTPLSLLPAISGRFTFDQLPPTTRQAVLDHTDPDDQQTLIRQILEMSGVEPRKVYETPEDRRKLDVLKAEDKRCAFHRRNRRLKDRADLIAEKAPTATCWRTATHRTSTEVSGTRVKCTAWSCSHCSQTKTARILSEGIERFSDCESVYVIPLADDDARNRFKNRLNKRSQRTGLSIGALVIPVAGSGFLAISRFSDSEGQRLKLTDAFDLLTDALDARSELARLDGTDLDKRRISRPGLEPVRDTAKDKDSPLRTNADKAEKRRPLGLIFREVSASDLTALVDQHNGKRSGRPRKGSWSYRFETEADADAFVLDLERLSDLVSDDKLTENRADRSNRVEWENTYA